TRALLGSCGPAQPLGEGKESAMAARRIGRTCGVVLALVAAPLLLTGCPKRPAMVGGSGAGPTGGPAAGTGAQQGTPPAPPPVAAAPTPAKPAGTTNGNAAGTRDIHFAVDRFDIQPRYQPVLDQVAGWLRANADARLVVEGHCDETGSAQHNLALGERRAQATRQYLVAPGVDPAPISIVSYGKERPGRSAPTEECRALNRRGHPLPAREAGASPSTGAAAT